MKTFIASLILLCAVATFIAFNTAYIVRISDEMLEIAESLPESKAAFEADIPSAMEKTQRLWDLWDKTIDKFAFTIGYGHIDRADYPCAACVEGVDMLFVAGYQVNIDTRLCKICAEHRAQRACTVYCCFHNIPLPIRFCAGFDEFSAHSE